MKLLQEQSATSVLVDIFIQDSSSAVGSGLTGLSAGSAGLTCYYHRDGDATTTAISLTNSSLGTFTSGGFVQLNSTNMPGAYQLAVPDILFADASRMSRARNAIVYLQGATNMAPCVLEFQISSEKTLSYEFMGKAITMPVSVPATTTSCTVDVALGYMLAQSAFKREQTANTETVYAIDGTTAMLKSDKSDDGTTFTRGAYTA